VFRDGVKKANNHLMLNLVRDVKDKKKSFYRYISSKRKIRENVGPLLNGAGDPVMRDMERAMAHNAFDYQ